MRITEKRLDAFMDRWELVFIERLSREEARRIATRLVNFYRLIVRAAPPAAPLAAEDHTSLEEA